MPFDKNQSTGYVATHMARLFTAALSERIRPLGITTGQLPILLELWSEEGLTQKQLITRLGLEQATVANTLARMERDGLIRRKPHPQDGRAQCLHLTPKARALEAEAIEAANTVNEIALADLPPVAQKAFLRVMGQVIEALQVDLRSEAPVDH